MPTSEQTVLPRVEIHLEALQLKRGTHTVFDGLDLRLGESRIGLIGDNGAGKSSLLRLISGLETPQQGRLRVSGQGIGDGDVRARWLGMMFQNPDEQIIFPTVDEELALGLTASGLSRREANARACAWLVARGRGDWVGRAIGSLSQGQRQQVCWLALLIAAPRMLLLDEPFSSLDLPGQALLSREIAQAPQQIIVSTHQLDHVRDFERVVWLHAGRVRASGPGREVCAAYEADVAERLAAPA
ncbi:MAG: transporter related protein [Rhodoferax sp.]|nr:transporter related protein [Rhodoferax sp.]